MASLVEKYRPKDLDGVHGQSFVAHQLRMWLECPHSNAFIFAGGTGCGKSSTAMALANELGVAVEEADFGGLHQISSGEQTGESVRQAMRAMFCRPMIGSGWRVLIVNEADAMTPNAAYTWLDALENLPPQSVVIFTTNSVHRMPQRLRDRCEAFEFTSSALLIKPELQDFARAVWLAETGRVDCPDIETFGTVQDNDGNGSFRRLLQQMEPHVRLANRGEERPARPETVAIDTSTAVPSPKTGQRSVTPNGWVKVDLRNPMSGSGHSVWARGAKISPGSARKALAAIGVSSISEATASVNSRPVRVSGSEDGSAVILDNYR